MESGTCLGAVPEAQPAERSGRPESADGKHDVRWPRHAPALAGLGQGFDRRHSINRHGCRRRRHGRYVVHLLRHQPSRLCRGIMTTASHNPIQYNGFKISGPKAKPIGAASGLDDIKRIASQLRVGQTGLQGGYEQADLWQPYRDHVLRFMNLKRKLRVAVDGSNGMAGKMVPAVFGKIPNLEIIPILFEITGSFTHDPNPLVDANLAMLREEMKRSKPDLGVCFDGD